MLENGLIIAPCLEYFPQFIEKGVSNIVQIHLYELGFTERLGNYALYNILESFENFSYTNNIQLQKLIIKNQKYIKNQLITQNIPTIAVKKVIENINFLNNDNSRK